MKSKTVFVKAENLIDIDLLDLNIEHALQLYVDTVEKGCLVMVNGISKEGVTVEGVNGEDIDEGGYYLFPIPIEYLLDKGGAAFSKDVEGIYYFDNDPSISLYFNDEGNVVLENNENTIVFPPYVHSLESALDLLFSTVEETNSDLLFKIEDLDEKSKSTDSFLWECKKILKETITHLLNSTPRKYEKGFTTEEVKSIRTVLEKMGADIKKFDDALYGITVLSIDEQTVYYPVDIMKAMQCAIEKRSLKVWEWD